MRLILALAALVASPALAQMSGEEFESRVLGRTLTYGGPDGAYGVERYHEGRRVTWAWLDGSACQEGTWDEPEPGLICFTYDDTPDPQCWHIFDEGTGLRAEFVTGEASILYEVVEEEPLVCPDYGV
ncbi:hypothetical protein [Wenxinia saemankumensis]|uniref:Uncharacterized protein n=1 Tax=Wenxinia saemankumensis TaxID=1447782 RepID=A0A1M6CL90_9RHOB|nr:hypothetical protein [Wenxinia saemankumensis]SHI61611.1 hypothetical protein SAMN05444417_1241 [Wenxinia saemankumensis]